MMKKYTFTALIAIATATLLTACGEKKSETAQLYGVITFMKGDVQVNQKAGAIGLKLVKEDTVAVKADSVAVVQFSTNAQITIESNTTVQIAELLKNADGKDTIAINQQSGSTFSKIMPGKTDYNIHTPAVTAGVRGTSFRVGIDDTGKKTRIQLLRGKVSVKSKAVAETPEAPVQETILLAGNEIEATETKVEAPAALDEKTVEALSQLDKVAMVPEVKLKQIEEAKPEEIETIMQEFPEIMPEATEEMLVPVEIPEEPKAEIKKDVPVKITLDDLKAKYKILSKVTTKSGKVYIGSFKQEGAKAEVITVDGPVYINAADIKKVEKY